MNRKSIVISLLAILFLSACNVANNQTNNEKDTTSDSDNEVLGEASNDNNTNEAVPTENSFVLLKTSLGDIKLELYNTTMPITAGNFQKLVEEGFYDGISFHRIIDGFMVQGGDPDGAGTGGPGYTIKDEFPPEATEQNTNARGTISMANAGPNTGGSQFFLNLVDNTNLDGRHPVFGKIVEGLDVLDKLGKVKTEVTDRPLEEVLIKKATVVE